MSKFLSPLEQRSMRYLMTSLLALVALQQGLRAEELPRLVVYITVEDLRTDYLEQLQPLLGSGGLGRLMHEGKVYPRLSYPLAELNRASATATLHTGAYPATHGVERPVVWLPHAGRVQELFHDTNYQGNYTRDSYSPKALLVQTLGDRMKEASGGSSIVYSLSADAATAIAAGGWTANGAYWLDSRMAAWSSSSYYERMPATLEAYNRSSDGPNKRLVSGQLAWSPLSRYTSPAESWSDWGRSFTHRYPSGDAQAFKRSALANEEVTRLALKLIDQGGYAESKTPGLLALSYSLDVAPEGQTSELSSEEVDAYVRLDRDLASIVSELERKLGRGRCLIALTGTGYSHYRRPRPKALEAHSGRFSAKKGAALLNLYLSALHGQGSWVERCADGRLYLNKKLAESRKLSLASLQDESAAFLAEMEGVGAAVAGGLLMQDAAGERALALRRAVHTRYQADVYWSLLPGWEVEESADSPNLWLQALSVDTPCILWGAGLTPKTFDYPILAAPDVVKAIARVLRIRPPNAAY